MFLGRWATILGLLTVGFAGWQTWGTGLLTARTQGQLENQFEQLLSQAYTPVALVDEPAEVAAPPPLYSEGTGEPAEPDGNTILLDAPGVQIADDLSAAYLTVPMSAPVARLRIPSIELERIVVLGDRRVDLQKGPGLAATRSAPGSAAGNAVIAGHRTTYGAPFFDFDRISTGDLIFVDTTYGSFTYRVEIHQIVSSRDPRLMSDTAEPRLTLYTCHPKYSTKERILVVAVPESPLAPLPILLAPGGGAAYLSDDLTNEPPPENLSATDAVMNPSGTAERNSDAGTEPVPSVEETQLTSKTETEPGQSVDSDAGREVELEAEQRWSRDIFDWASVLMWFSGFAVVRHLSARLWAWRRALAAPASLLWVSLALGLFISFGAVVPAGI